jgi:hypothetical protein
LDFFQKSRSPILTPLPACEKAFGITVTIPKLQTSQDFVEFARLYLLGDRSVRVSC